jgi:Na+/melibiose symporter-like transporter
VQDTQFIVLLVSFIALILTSAVLMFGRRPVARRLTKDPQEQVVRSVELAAGWTPTVLSLGFPLMALLIPLNDVERGFQYMVVGFFAVGTAWMLAVAKLPKLTHLMAHQAYAGTLGSRDRGESPELYEDVLRRFLPRAGAVVALAFVIVLLRVLVQG